MVGGVPALIFFLVTRSGHAGIETPAPHSRKAQSSRTTVFTPVCGAATIVATEAPSLAHPIQNLYLVGGEGTIRVLTSCPPCAIFVRERPAAYLIFRTDKSSTSADVFSAQSRLLYA